MEITKEWLENEKVKLEKEIEQLNAKTLQTIGGRNVISYLLKKIDEKEKEG